MLGRTVLVERLIGDDGRWLGGETVRAHLARLRLWRRRRRTRRQLLLLQSHHLDDIGLSAADRGIEGRKWFWQD